MGKMYQIEEELANALLNYLGTKPYGEVFGYINALQKIQPIGSPIMPTPVFNPVNATP